MKGSNPFAFLEDSPEGICGRKYESGIFNGFVQSTSAKQPRLLVVSGGPGSGKTFLLRYFRHEAEKGGLLAPYAKAEKGESEASLAERLYRDTAMLLGFKASAAPDSFEGLADGLVKGGKGKNFGIVIIIDDFDNLRKSDAAAAEIARLVASLQGKRELSFVLGTTREMGGEGAVALHLKNFDAHETKEYVENALGRGPPKMGEECLNSIMDGTGGNPRLLKTVCRHIYERLRENERVITKGHYLAYLPYIMSMLSSEWFGAMYQATPPGERGILRALAKNDGGAHISDIARGLKRPLGPITALTKRLLDSGQIVKLDRGKYRVFSKLYARYVVQREE